MPGVTVEPESYNFKYTTWLPFAALSTSIERTVAPEPNMLTFASASRSVSTAILYEKLELDAIDNATITPLNTS